MNIKVRQRAIEKFMSAVKLLDGELTESVLKKHLARMSIELEEIDAIVDALHTELDALQNK